MSLLPIPLSACLEFSLWSACEVPCGSGQVGMCFFYFSRKASFPSVLKATFASYRILRWWECFSQECEHCSCPLLQSFAETWDNLMEAEPCWAVPQTLNNPDANWLALGTPPVSMDLVSSPVLGDMPHCHLTSLIKPKFKGNSFKNMRISGW